MACRKSYLYDYRHAFGEHAIMKYFKVKEYKSAHYATWSNVAYARKDFYGKTQLSFFPNPISTGSALSVYCGVAVYKIDLFDIEGRWMNTFDMQGESTLQLDLSGLSKGMYFAKAETEAEILMEKIALE
jgi:hypothetical protein